MQTPILLQVANRPIKNILRFMSWFLRSGLGGLVADVPIKFIVDAGRPLGTGLHVGLKPAVAREKANPAPGFIDIGESPTD